MIPVLAILCVVLIVAFCILFSFYKKAVQERETFREERNLPVRLFVMVTCNVNGKDETFQLPVYHSKDGAVTPAPENERTLVRSVFKENRNAFSLRAPYVTVKDNGRVNVLGVEYSIA